MNFIRRHPFATFFVLFAVAFIGVVTGASIGASHGTRTVTVNPAATASQRPSAPAAQSPPAPQNPVPILKRAGGVTTAKLGNTDANGNRFAQGDLPGATVPGCAEYYTADGKCTEALEVTTYADAAAQAADEIRNPPTDAVSVVRGHLFTVYVYPVSADYSTQVFPVPPSVIAARTGGTVAG